MRHNECPVFGLLAAIQLGCIDWAGSMVQVQAEGLDASVQELQARLQRAHEDLALKRQTVEGLTHKFDR